MSSLEAVLFDLDGTLLDSIDLIVASFEHTLREADLAPRSRQQILAEIGRPLLRVFPEWSGAPQRTQELIAIFREWNLDHHDELARPFPGVVDAVAQLRSAGMRMGVVTSKLSDSARRGLALCGVEDAMEVLIACDDVERHKPDPLPVLLGCERLGVAPERCAYVGDAVVDLLAGRAAGVQTAGVGWGSETAHELLAHEPDWWFERPSDWSQLLAPAGA
ncbi:MAG: HAD-IA family hydrolase [Planctomycetota bacterium]|nr:HAD-IA family hydrolase [Planctomycetota bacterium]